MDSLNDLVAGLRPRPDGYGVRVKTVGDHHVDVVPMLYTDRVCTTPVGAEYTYDRFWCYPRGGAALLAALAWDPGEGGEPVGWLKAWDGRRHG